jgi:AraC-like DNA-binding protein
MPIGMPKATLITIQKRDLPSDFHMPQMEKADNHYSLGYILSGDRRFITPYEQYDAHKGYVTAMPPGIYHRTISLSDKPYINYLIKMSSSFADRFCREIDEEIWNYIFEQKSFYFDDNTCRKIEFILEDMLEIFEEKKTFYEELLKGLLYRLMVLIKENNIAGNSSQFKGELSKDIMEAMYYVEQNYCENIKLSDVASRIGFSEGHFSRRFCAKVGVPFSNYLTNIRLRHAKELLMTTDLSIGAIALKVGFGSGDYLSACFSKNEGQTPTAYRKMIRTQNSVDNTP